MPKLSRVALSYSEHPLILDPKLRDPSLLDGLNTMFQAFRLSEILQNLSAVSRLCFLDQFQHGVITLEPHSPSRLT
jgi:hypothetical protein